MKRYKIELRYQYPDDVWVKATIDNDGNWVKWEDVEKLKTENTTLKKMNMYIKPMAVESRREAAGVACNCEAMSDIMRLRPWGSDKHWICPAHGYKRP